LQLERVKKLFSKYNIPISRFAIPTGICEDGGFAALVKVGHTSGHSLEESKECSGGHECWERKLLISQEQMEAGVATELLQSRLFAPDHEQPPSPGSLCIIGGKVKLVDLPVGMDDDTLHRTNELQLVRKALLVETHKRKSG